ncbi:MULTISPECIES: hypothetical protein [Streptacidiphilus]|uniref:HTH merR-type domain-containing protein n=1 Tax=Streptacidiphilus cavernicola TaxID=3342716 RepID=A0ABV6V0A3_9ACTN|nr:hypothetical protein [Streptacidiphilus jeojiense]
MSAETPPAPTTARLDGLPDEITAQEIAGARGVSVATVRNWMMKLPGWPDSVGKRGKALLYPNTAVAQVLADNEAGRIDTSGLGDDPAELVTLPTIAERTGLPQGTVSAYPALYGPASNDPFPAGDSLGRRRVGDVAAWLSRRTTLGGIRPVAAATGKSATPAASKTKITEGDIDINGIQEETGLGREAAKSLLRRPELAAMSTGKVGRNRIWPRAALLAELKKLGYNVRSEKPARLTAAERAWLSEPRSASELAEHYSVTIGAITHRLQRAREAGAQVPESVDPTATVKKYDPAEFDGFWKR